MTIEFVPLAVIEGSAIGGATFAFRSGGTGTSITPGDAFGGATFAFVSGGEGEAGEAVDPFTPGSGGAGFLLNAGGEGFVEDFGEGSAAFGLQASGFEVPADGGTGGAEFGFVAYGYDADVPTAFTLMVARKRVVSSYGELYFGVLRDGLALNAPLAMLPTMVLREMLALGVAAPQLGVEVAAELQDEIVLGDDLGYTLFVVIEEGLLLGASVVSDYTAFVRVVSRLVLEGRAAGYPEALAQILDALVLGAMIEGLRKGETADTLLLGESITAQYIIFAQILERLLLAGSLTPTYTIVAVIEEKLLLRMDLASQVDLVAVLRESIGFAATLTLDNGDYIAWVLNTEGQKALSRYTNYPYNSMTKIGERYYGAASDGVHRLEGNNDNGEAIAARLRAGLSNFGTNREKRLPECFIGMRTDGAMLLWVIQVNGDTGEKEAGIFKVKPRPAENTRETRAKTGRGFKAVQFDFVLQNIDGADFDVSSIEWRPLGLDRRTRG